MDIDEFKIEEWMNEYESIADIDLCATTISPLSIKELLTLCNKNYQLSEIENIPLTYGEILGSGRLIHTLATLYTNQTPQNITITHGAIGANQLVFLSLLDCTDEVISIVPNYQQHSSIPKSIGAKVKEIFLKEENSWLIDIEEIKAHITNKTKLITFSNPNNPTGSVIPDEQLLDLAKLADKYGIWILSDEAYRGLNLFGKNYSQAMCDIYEKGISVGSMSKTYSLPGLRLGWIATQKKLIEKINIHRQYNTISISIVDDYLSTIALENRMQIEKRNLAILKENYETLQSLISSSPVLDCILPQGGTTTLVKYSSKIPSTKLCKNFQAKTKISLLPGSTMDMEGFVRIGIGVKNKDLKYGIEELSKYINAI